MAEPILCPSCQKPLRVSSEVRLAWLTCPRCRALIANPAVHTEPQPAAIVPPPIVSETAAPGEREVYHEVCPGCGKRAKAQWLFCPHCEEPLHAPRSTGMEDLVRRDAVGPKGYVASLTALGAMGIVLTLLITGGALSYGKAEPMAVVLLCFLVLVGISTVSSLIRNQGELRSRGVGRIFRNALAIAGALVALAGILVFAGIVFAVFSLLGGRW